MVKIDVEEIRNELLSSYLKQLGTTSIDEKDLELIKSMLCPTVIFIKNTK